MESLATSQALNVDEVRIAGGPHGAHDRVDDVGIFVGVRSEDLPESLNREPVAGASRWCACRAQVTWNVTSPTSNAPRKTRIPPASRQPSAVRGARIRNSTLWTGSSQRSKALVGFTSASSSQASNSRSLRLRTQSCCHCGRDRKGRPRPCRNREPDDSPRRPGRQRCRRSPRSRWCDARMRAADTTFQDGSPLAGRH